MINNKITNKHGFTLVELMIVIAIIGILASLAIPNLKLARDRTREAKCFEYLALLSRTAEIYYLEKKVYPDAIQDLDPFLGSGKQGIKCPSAGEYSELEGSRDSGLNATFQYKCSIHGVNPKTFGSAM